MLGTNIEKAAAGKETSLFTRIPFTLDSVDDITTLTLRMKYDDGFVAYLNGVEVARDRVPDGDVPYNARATRSHADRQAVVFDNFAITEHIDQLKVGENVLAIHGLFRQQIRQRHVDFARLGKWNRSGIQRRGPARRQIGNPKIDFGVIENQPASGNQAEEFIELTNSNSAAVDISGWTVSSGEMSMTFKGGTVIPAGTSMYVAANKPAFKTRAEGPTGGQHLFVIGNYEGNLSNAGGTISLTAADGEVVSTQEFTGEISEVQNALVITEINYNPLDPSSAELAQNVALDPEDFEFVEIQNVSDAEVSLDGVKFSNGIEFDFTGSNVQSLAAGDRVVVVKDLDAFTLRYGAAAASRVAGQFSPGTGLGNAGERITLLDAGNSVVTEFRYDVDSDTGWPSRADGRGSTLVLADAEGDPNDGLSWIASSQIGGTPGTDANATFIPNVVINEVLANSDDPATDTIELLNRSSDRVSLANMYLSDGAGTSDALARFAIPTTTLDPRSYVLFDESDFNVGENGFALSSNNGESIYLTIGDENGPTHFVDSVSFGATMAGETYGRINGTDMFAPMEEATLGVFNSDPRVGPVVITEIQRDAGSPSAAALEIYPALDGGDLEFIEIHNPLASAVNLNNWRIRGGVDMTFDREMIGPGETLVVVSFAAEREDNARSHGCLPNSLRIGG